MKTWEELVLFVAVVLMGFVAGLCIGVAVCPVRPPCPVVHVSPQSHPVAPAAPDPLEYQ